VNSDPEGSSRELLELEERVEECKSVLYREPCRKVLRKIIDLWVEGKEATIYVLEEKELRNISHVGIERSVKLLSECGLILVKTGFRPKTGSPKGKKLLYPTPLGLVMNTILSFLYPEELGIERNEVAYPLAWYYVENTLFQRLPLIYDYIIQASREGVASSEYKRVLKGYLTTLQALNTLFLKAVKASEKIGLDIKPSYSSKGLLELIKSNMSEDIEYLERALVSVKEGSVHHKILKYLYKSYDLLAKALGVHGKYENTTQITSHMS